jgi:hypothetical protein
MQLSVHHRDDEIKRLADQISSGTENDFANLTVRNEMNEGIIISLNQQVWACRHPEVKCMNMLECFARSCSLGDTISRTELHLL